MNLVVRGATIDWGGGARPCALGRAGIAVKRGEGDGVTPLGTFPLRRVLYRPDRIARPKSALPVSAIAPADGWCDAPDDPAYNTRIRRPCRASHESLWREDRLYDLVVVVGFNDAPVVPGAGSAIFLHVARPDFGPTQGCVALALADLAELTAALAPGDAVTITP